MKRLIIKILKVGSWTLGLLVVLFVVAGVWMVRRPWPQISGTAKARGLQASVEVIRDKWGIPHLYASNAHDLFFVQGYVHAQDRLWQMVFNRLISNGSLSKYLGAATLEADQFLRTIGLRRAAERDWDACDPETRAILQAYADGVNAYVEAHRKRLPIEFTLLSVDPDPWTPVDTLAWGKLMCLNLGMNQSLELIRMRMAGRLGEAAVRDLLPPYPEFGPLIISPASSGGHPIAALAATGFEALTRGMAWGSNNWVVHGSRTATHQPILANDTHLDLGMPSIWYENGLHGGGYDCVGFSLPGIPAIILGHNRDIAWGVTNTCADIQDYFVEKLDAADHPRRYQFRDEWRDLDTVTEKIEVAGQTPVALRVLSTHHGPLMNDAIKSLKGGSPLSLSWTALQPTGLIRAILLLDRAGDWGSFREALRYWDAPSLNFVYADIHNHIGYQATGRIPVRMPGSEGIVPATGWDGLHEWQGFIPYDELPSVLDPPAGFIVTANNKVVTDAYPYHLAYDYADPFRAKRITEILAANGRVTTADMESLHAQTYSPPAVELRAYLQAVTPSSPQMDRALKLVQEWDLREETDSQGAAVFNAWYYFLVADTLRDDLGDELWNENKQFLVTLAPVFIDLMRHPDSEWFDDKQTAAHENRDDMVRRSFDDAMTWLQQRLGNDPEKWQWGRVHRLTFVHQPLGNSGMRILELLFNSKQIPVRGGIFTVDSALPNMEQPFDVFFGVSQRMIIDLGDLDRSLAVNSTGQSGLLFHKHREDQIPLWQAVQYHPMLWGRGTVESSSEGTLTLSPQ